MIFQKKKKRALNRSATPSPTILMRPSSTPTTPMEANPEGSPSLLSSSLVYSPLIESLPLPSPPPRVLPSPPHVFLSDVHFRQRALFQEVYVLPALPSLASPTFLSSSGVAAHLPDRASAAPSAVSPSLAPKKKEEKTRDATEWENLSRPLPVVPHSTAQHRRRKKPFPHAVLVSPWWAAEKGEADLSLEHPLPPSSAMASPTLQNVPYALQYTFSPACLGWRCPSCGEMEIEKIFWQDEMEAARGKKQELYQLYHRIAALRQRAIQGPPHSQTPRSPLRHPSPWAYLLQHVAHDPALLPLLFRPPPPQSKSHATRKFIKERSQMIPRMCGNCVLCPRCSGIPIAVQWDMITGGSAPSPMGQNGHTALAFPTRTTVTSRVSLCGLRLRIAPHSGELYFTCPYCAWCSTHGVVKAASSGVTSPSIPQKQKKEEKKNGSHSGSTVGKHPSAAVAPPLPLEPPQEAEAEEEMAAGENEPDDHTTTAKIHPHPPPSKQAGTIEPNGFFTVDALLQHCQQWSTASGLLRSFEWWRGRMVLCEILQAYRPLWTPSRIDSGGGGSSNSGSSTSAPSPATAPTVSFSFSLADEMAQFLLWKRLQWGSPFVYAKYASSSSFLGGVAYRPPMWPSESGETGVLREMGGKGGYGGSPSSPMITLYTGQKPTTTLSRRAWDLFLQLRMLSYNDQETLWALEKDAGAALGEAKPIGRGGGASSSSSHHPTNKKEPHEDASIRWKRAIVEALQWVQRLAVHPPSLVMECILEVLQGKAAQWRASATPWRSLPIPVMAQDTSSSSSSSSSSGGSAGPVKPLHPPTTSIPSYVVHWVENLSRELGAPPTQWWPSSSATVVSPLIDGGEGEGGEMAAVVPTVATPPPPPPPPFHAAAFCTAIKAKDYVAVLRQQMHARHHPRRAGTNSEDRGESTASKDPDERGAVVGVEGQKSTLEEKRKGTHPHTPSQCPTALTEDLVEAEMYIASHALHAGAAVSHTMPPVGCPTGVHPTATHLLPHTHTPLVLRMIPPSCTLAGASHTSSAHSLFPPSARPLEASASASSSSSAAALTLQYTLPPSPKQLLTAVICRVELPREAVVQELLRRVMIQFPETTPGIGANRPLLSTTTTKAPTSETKEPPTKRRTTKKEKAWRRVEKQWGVGPTARRGKGMGSTSGSSSRFLLLLDGQQDEEITAIRQYWESASADRMGKGTNEEEEKEEETETEEEDEEEEDTTKSEGEKKRMTPHLSQTQKTKQKEDRVGSSTDFASLSSSSVLPFSGAEDEGVEGEGAEANVPRPMSHPRGSSTLSWLLSGGRVTAASVFPFIDARWGLPSPPDLHRPHSLPPPEPVLRLAMTNLTADDVVLCSVSLTHVAYPASSSLPSSCGRRAQRGWRLLGEDAAAERLLPPPPPPSSDSCDTGGFSSSSAAEVILMPREGYTHTTTCWIPPEEEEDAEAALLTDAVVWRLERDTGVPPSPVGNPSPTPSPPSAASHADKKEEEEEDRPAWIGLTVRVRVALPLDLLRSLRRLFSSLLTLPSSSCSPANGEEEEEDGLQDVVGNGAGGLFAKISLEESSCFYASSPPQVWHEVEYGIVLVL